jgi:hypothetical protein
MPISFWKIWYNITRELKRYCTGKSFLIDKTIRLDYALNLICLEIRKYTFFTYFSAAGSIISSRFTSSECVIRVTKQIQPTFVVQNSHISHEIYLIQLFTCPSLQIRKNRLSHRLQRLWHSPVAKKVLSHCFHYFHCLPLPRYKSWISNESITVPCWSPSIRCSGAESMKVAQTTHLSGPFCLL